jgi:hypothetical protein
MSYIHIGGSGGRAFSYDMKTGSYSMSQPTSPIYTMGRYDVVDVVPEHDDDFHFKVDIVLLLAKFGVV